MLFIKKALINTKPFYSFEKGFTLIEVMSALVISGILLSIAIPSMNNFLMNQRLSQAHQALARAFGRSQAAAKQYKESWVVTLTLEGDRYVVGSFPLSGYTLPLTAIPTDVYTRCYELGIPKPCTFTKLHPAVEQRIASAADVSSLEIDEKGHFSGLSNRRFKVKIKDSLGGASYGIRCVLAKDLLGSVKIEDSETTPQCD